jgi:hypothetical protein
MGAANIKFTFMSVYPNVVLNDYDETGLKCFDVPKKSLLKMPL